MLRPKCQVLNIAALPKELRPGSSWSLAQVKSIWCSVLENSFRAEVPHVVPQLLPQTLIKFKDGHHLLHRRHHLALNSPRGSPSTPALLLAFFSKAKPTQWRLTVTQSSNVFPLISSLKCFLHPTPPPARVEKTSAERIERKWGLMGNAHHSLTNACWWNTLLILNTPSAETVHLFSCRPLIDLSFLFPVLWK